MKQVKKSVLLWYSAREMYDLVVAVEDYRLFMPWCESSEVLERHAATPGEPEVMIARLGLNYAGVRQSFTTRNENLPGRSMRLKLVDGPFSNLEGCWLFQPLAQGGEVESEAPAACRIDFELSYAFANRPLEMLLSPVFDRIANTFVDAFVRRAAEVYGER